MNRKMFIQAETLEGPVTVNINYINYIYYVLPPPSGPEIFKAAMVLTSGETLYSLKDLEYIHELMIQDDINQFLFFKDEGVVVNIENIKKIVRLPKDDSIQIQFFKGNPIPFNIPYDKRLDSLKDKKENNVTFIDKMLIKREINIDNIDIIEDIQRNVEKVKLPSHEFDSMESFFNAYNNIKSIDDMIYHEILEYNGGCCISLNNKETLEIDTHMSKALSTVRLCKKALHEERVCLVKEEKIIKKVINLNNVKDIYREPGHENKIIINFFSGNSVLLEKSLTDFLDSIRDGREVPFVLLKNRNKEEKKEKAVNINRIIYIESTQIGVQATIEDDPNSKDTSIYMLCSNDIDKTDNDNVLAPLKDLISGYK